MKEKQIQDKYYIAVFDSRSHAIQLYQRLKKMHYNQFKIISTPCIIKTGCSYSIRFDTLEDYHILMEEAKKINKIPSKAYTIERINKQRVISKLDIT